MLTSLLAAMGLPAPPPGGLLLGEPPRKRREKSSVDQNNYYKLHTYLHVHLPVHVICMVYLQMAHEERGGFQQQVKD